MEITSGNLRFLLTDSCNIRCSFCHNEFQGDIVPRGKRYWDRAAVSSLLTKAQLSGKPRIKISGGEPLLRWQDLVFLVRLGLEYGINGSTVFTNLTLATHDRLSQLVNMQVRGLNCNLPSFLPDTFLQRTGQSRWPLEDVLRNARLARRIGLSVQFNLVVPQMSDPAALNRLLDQEISATARHVDAFDTLALVVDDWGTHKKAQWELVTQATRSRLNIAEEYSPDTPRSCTFSHNGKKILVSRCTDWTVEGDRDEADIYIIPPGIPLVEHTRGKAYLQWSRP